MVTFQLSTPQPFVPKQTQQQLTVYPLDYRTVMIPIEERQPFNVTVSLRIPLTLDFSPSETLVQFGVLGPPGQDQWKGVADCSTGVKVQLQAQNMMSAHSQSVPLFSYCLQYFSIEGPGVFHQFSIPPQKPGSNCLIYFACKCVG